MPLSLAFGTAIVIGLYVLANVAYLVVLPFDQSADTRRSIASPAPWWAPCFPAPGARSWPIAIMISTFGCINGMVLAGARACFAMAQDDLFFRPAKKLNKAQVPGVALILQALWTTFLVLPRTYDAATGSSAISTATCSIT